MAKEDVAKRLVSAWSLKVINHRKKEGRMS
jgi:hypothetical protein